MFQLSCGFISSHSCSTSTWDSSCACQLLPFLLKSSFVCWYWVVLTPPNSLSFNYRMHSLFSVYGSSCWSGYSSLLPIVMRSMTIGIVVMALMSSNNSQQVVSVWKYLTMVLLKIVIIIYSLWGLDGSSEDFMSGSGSRIQQFFVGASRIFLSIIRSPYKNLLSINVPEFMEAKLKFYIDLPENLPKFLRYHDFGDSEAKSKKML